MKTINYKEVNGKNWKAKLHNYCRSQEDINLWYSDDNNLYGVKTKKNYSVRTILNVIGFAIGALDYNLKIDIYDAYNALYGAFIVKFKITEEDRLG